MEFFLPWKELHLVQKSSFEPKTWWSASIDGDYDVSKVACTRRTIAQVISKDGDTYATDQLCVIIEGHTHLIDVRRKIM